MITKTSTSVTIQWIMKLCIKNNFTTEMNVAHKFYTSGICFSSIESSLLDNGSFSGVDPLLGIDSSLVGFCSLNSLSTSSRFCLFFSNHICKVRRIVRKIVRILIKITTPPTPAIRSKHCRTNLSMAETHPSV